MKLIGPNNNLDLIYVIDDRAFIFLIKRKILIYVIDYMNNYLDHIITF